MATTIVQSKPYIVISGPEAQGIIDNLLVSFRGQAGARVLELDVQTFLQLEGFLATLRTQLEGAGVVDPLPVEEEVTP